MNKNEKKILLAFDMDNTILSGYSDYSFFHLLSEESRRQIAPLTDNTNWAHYMQNVFFKLKQDNVKIEQIKEAVQSIPFNPGFIELFDFIKENKDKFENIIISGANTLYIKWILEKHNIGDIFQEYYANIASEDDECLIKIVPYHDHDCTICQESQCKQLILNSHINEKDYSKIIYARDGDNDYCPALLLSEKDILFPRAEYVLHHMLFKNNSIKDLKCEVFPWHDGFAILKELKKLI